jgi:hypothetical protein
MFDSPVAFSCLFDVDRRAGETPYNIDVAHQKPIMGQVFGSRKLNTNEDSENMLGTYIYNKCCTFTSDLLALDFEVCCLQSLFLDRRSDGGSGDFIFGLESN